MQSSFLQAIESRLADLSVSQTPSGAITANINYVSQQNEPLQLLSSTWQSSTASERMSEAMLKPNDAGRLLIKSSVVQTPMPILCSCSCHTPVSVHTPQWLGSAFGTLQVKYSKDPSSCRYCAHKDCRKGPQPVLKTNYYFPRWLLRHAMCLQLDYSPWGGHSVSLRTPRVISANSPVFSYAQHNNISGMRRLFQQNLASPFDVSYEEGRSALHVGSYNLMSGSVLMERSSMLLQLRSPRWSNSFWNNTQTRRSRITIVCA